jgi:FkbM family methyltransferase
MGSDLIDGEIDIIDNFIKDNDIVFDVGAYVGEWSQEVRKKNPNVILHQFEPSINSFKLLKNNYKNDRLVVQNNVLVFREEKDVDFFYYSNLPILSTIYRRNKDVEKEHNLNQTIYTVKSITIDNYCFNNNINKINFLKIDTEGGELDVVYGANNMLNNHNIDFIQFEYGGCFQDAKITLKSICNYLFGKKYEVFKILGNSLLKIEKIGDDLEQYDYCNFFAKKISF